MDKLKDLFQKYKDLILYGVFGILTTIANIAVYWLMAHPFHLSTMSSTIAAWVAAVLFAYVTNRKWVFHSEARTKNEIIKEISSFFACRLATGVVDWLCMWIFVDILLFHDVAIKTIANVVVIILNYVASKLVVFNRKDS